MKSILALAVLLSLTPQITTAQAVAGDYIWDQKQPTGPAIPRKLTPVVGRIVGWPSNINTPGTFTLGTGFSVSGSTINVTGGTPAWADITGKPSVFPPDAHTQAISTITGLQTELDAKLNSATAASTYAPLASPTFTGTITGNGSGLTALNASNISSGIIPLARTFQSGVAAASYTTPNITVDIYGRVTSITSRTATQIIDTIGSTQGQVLFRGASAWTALAPGTNGQVLTSGGAGANPTWTTVSGGGLTIGSTAITGGTSGRVLISGTTVSEQATTGTGDIVRASSPSLVTPALGTPSGVNLTNGTALPAWGVVGTAITEAGSAAHDRILCANQQYQFGWVGSALSTTGSGNSNVFNDGRRDVFTNTTAGSTSRMSMFSGVPNTGLEVGGLGSGRNFPWNKRVTLSFSIASGATSANGNAWFRLGGNNTTADMTLRGIGIKITNKTVVLEVHNGTTRATSATIATVSADYTQQHFLLQSDGAGNVSVWVNGVFALTLAGGPATVSASDVIYIMAAVANNADAAQNQWTFMPVWVRVAP
jgi:hypothetical protein